MISDHKISREKRRLKTAISSKQKNSITTTEQSITSDHKTQSIWADPDIKFTAGIVLYDYIYDHVKETRTKELRDFVIKMPTTSTNATVIKGEDRREAAKLTVLVKNAREDT